MDNVDEMDKFLEKYNFPKLDQEEIENLNRPITSMEIETVIRNLPANKSPCDSPRLLPDIRHKSAFLVAHTAFSCSLGYLGTFLRVTRTTVCGGKNWAWGDRSCQSFELLILEKMF